MSPILTLFAYVQSRVQTRREQGSVAIEYALLATLIAMVIIAAVTGVGTRLITKFNAITF